MPPKPAATKPKTKGPAPAKAAPKGAGGKTKAKQPETKSTSDPKKEKEAENKPMKELPIRNISLKEIPKVLMQDEGGKVSESGRWPLVLDPSERAATFVKYQNVNYINACEPRDMQPNIVRRSLIGAIRFGKAFVVDMMNNDMYDVLSDTLAQIRPRLMDMLLDKSILEEENYLKLVKDEDGDEYSELKFSPDFIKEFKFIALTSRDPPPEKFMASMYPLFIEP